MNGGNLSRSRFRLAWILAPIGLLVAAIPGRLLLMGVTRQAVHPNPQAIPSATHAASPPQWSDAVDRARRIIRTGVAEQNLPGLSVAVGVGGALAWAEGFGWADIESRVPVTPDTRFRIGTASTALTSTAAGILLEKSRLALDDEIQTYVPQFPKKQWPVTLRQLMAHVGGVGTDRGDDGPLFRQRCERPVEALPQFANDPLLFEPGTQYRYSKYGWILVSEAVEAAAQRPFLTFMAEEIFQPLGMAHTAAEFAAEENPERVGEPAEDAPIFTLVRDVVLKPLGMGGAKTVPATAPATVYSEGFGHDPLVRYGMYGTPTRNLSCYTGSMAFLSTPSDLVRFGLAIDRGALLKPATAGLLQTSQRLSTGQETGHGLGWDLDGLDGELMGRKVVSLVMFRESGIVVAVMSNLSHADTPALARRVAEEFALAARQTGTNR